MSSHSSHRLRVARLLVAFPLFLTLTSCHRSQGDVAANEAAYPNAANVGPIPGNVTVVHQTLDPYLKDAVAIQEGSRLYGWYNCSGCHGAYGGGGMGPSLRDSTWIYGNSDAQLRDTLIHGRSNGMPAWGNKMPEDQMWKLIAYIDSLTTPMEPNPPSAVAEEIIPTSDFYKPSAPVAANMPAGSAH